MKDKRENIIAAAVQVFAQKGYHNTRMEEIAAIAGIGKGTIYEYFDSKMQLFQEMLEQSLQYYYSRLKSQEGEQYSIKERLCLLLESHFKFCLENRKLAKIIFWDNVCDEELKEWTIKSYKEKEERMQSFVQAGISSGEFKPVNARLLTHVLVGALSSIWIPAILGDWQMNPAETARRVTDLLWCGIGQ